jgi:NTP pyrophosphatase (non-canonical NTP hydrolase)
MGLIHQAVAFREAFEFPVEFTEDWFELQQALIKEESAEVLEACEWARLNGYNTESSEELLKELADLVFVCYQMAAYMQWDLDDAMNRVFESNMSKLGEDGKPVRREDGKVLKGPNYKPPTLTDIITEFRNKDAKLSPEH